MNINPERDMIGAIELAIKTKIESSAQRLGYRLKKVESYAGEFSDGLDRHIKDFPAVLIALANAPLEKGYTSLHKFKAQFAIICCANNLRGEKDARHGDGQTVGSYQLAQDMIRILTGQTLGLEIAPLAPKGIRAMINDRADGRMASVYAVDMDTSFTIEIAEDAEALDDFETLHNNWDVTPHGNVELPLPADDTADVTDHITLPISED